MWQFKPSLKYGLLVILAITCFSYLGFWQLDRAAEKRLLHEEFNRKQTITPLAFDNLLAKHNNLDDITWYKTIVVGNFIKPDLLIDNQIKKGKSGYFVLSPFKVLDNDRILFINRGWLPMGLSRTTIPHITTREHQVELIGTLKLYPYTGIQFKATSFEQLNDTSYRIQYVDQDILEQNLNLKTMPFLLRLDQQSEDSFLLDWHKPGFGERKHYGYAFQWFSFAALALILYVVLHTKRKQP